MGKSSTLWVCLCVYLASHANGVSIQAHEDGSGSGDTNGLEIPPIYPLPPSPTRAPPSPSPFAKVDFDSEPIGGSVIIPPPPLAKQAEDGETDGEGSGSDADAPDDPSGEGLPYEDPPMQMPADKPTNMPLYHLRKDSFNPYCDTCKLVALSHDMDNGGEGCKLAPESRKEACEKMDKLFKRNMDSQMLLLGCIDKTGPVPMRCSRDIHLKNMMFEETKIYPDQCPAIVMCNIIEDESGGPLCGKVLRGWGDFLPEDKPHRASGRPTPWDTYPKAIQPPRIAPPPWLGVYPGNQYCDLCVDVMNQKQANKTADETYSCIRQPQSLMWKCMDVAKTLLADPTAQRVLAEGCVDRTGKEAVDKPAGECPGLVACNLIGTPSGPMCGDMVEQYGDLKEAPGR